MIQFSINEDLCTQCGECAADCPAGIIAMDGYPKITDEERCYLCQHCLAVCPTGAVSVLGKDPGASTKLSGNMVDPGQLEILIKGQWMQKVTWEVTILPEARTFKACYNDA